MHLTELILVADPGFPIVGGGGVCGPIGGHGPPTQALFDENVCKKRKNWVLGGGMHPACPLDPPMYS